MDWSKESVGISDVNLRNVFKYEPEATRVAKIQSPNKKIDIKLLETDKEWDQWMDTELPSPDNAESGLILILARRTGQQTPPIGQDIINNEKTSEPGESNDPLPPNLGGRRGARVLPFSVETFRSISNKFCLHNSIARVVNRADVPIFSREELEMGQSGGSKYPAYVYNCRSTNAWEKDLALTATHFPHIGLTYAMLFGCPISVEDEVIRRLSSIDTAASHPLLMPGIFAELERRRHIGIVEDYIDKIEGLIFELDYQAPAGQQVDGSKSERRNKDKRTQWLDTVYLKHNLINWNTQLGKMAKHADELNDILFKPDGGQQSYKESSSLSNISAGKGTDETKVYNCEMRKIGTKINDRLQIIIEEYEEKARDCTMRIDGMAMATQWFQGETNVDIALATRRDSQDMRSIAIVTMVFLPGTFFASFFSMQFFNWFPDAVGDTVVSQYFWIFVLVTAMGTLLTVGTWYYIAVVARRAHRREEGSENDLSKLV
ncbi:uncharacterized protein F4822DRAFT_90772 [Hypoxylon trugodes]|uniref:uncharacterized protein n=1 Tax=Hypoxylon trugodes TaxID=326681 RepID=UPI00219831F8|nr:uncharacterized protein F4822DRAFT_90772 [Hypoxylon trugodes]KAI1383039.1 hypothetical protein F4822DRAFT_90772 [Hypoxylon trugodes]